MLALHKPDTIFSLRHAPTWLLLTMAAGSVNAGAFLASQRFVTHLTGGATHIGMRAGELSLILDYGVVLGCFIAGAMASTVFVDARFYRGRAPLYAVPLLVVAAILIVVAGFGAAGTFGPFGGEELDAEALCMLAPLSFALGLQNATVATATQQVVRTTHLTGPATDLGVHLARCLFTTGQDRTDALKNVALRGAKVVGFVAGAAIMVPAAGRFAFLAFLFPAFLVAGATALSFAPEGRERAAQLEKDDPSYGDRASAGRVSRA